MLPDHPDDQARLFYLVLLGAAVAWWGFSHYRGRLGLAAQNALLWGLIFMGVMVAYGFKDQIQRQLFGADGVTVGDGTLAFDRASDGHFHATLEVNGVPVRMLIDTGASSLVLTEADAREAGIDTGAFNYQVPVSTAGGTVMSTPVRLERVTLGPYTDRGMRALVNGAGLDISLMGLDYLDRYASWRVEGDTLYLTR